MPFGEGGDWAPGQGGRRGRSDLSLSAALRDGRWVDDAEWERQHVVRLNAALFSVLGVGSFCVGQGKRSFDEEEGSRAA